MSSSDAGQVVDGLAASIAAVGDVDLAVLSPAERAGFVAALEGVAARLSAAQIGVLDAVDRGGFHHSDGMRNARTHLRSHAHLSYADASARWTLAQALRDLDVVAAAFATGRIGVAQARRFARVWANPRVRDLLAGAQEPLVAIAETEQYPWFDRAMTEWERRADPDGTAERERAVSSAALRRLYDGTWALEGRFTSATGAFLDEVVTHFVAAELATDWSVARETHGPHATEAHLPRSAAQRRADAVVAIFLQAVTTPPGGREPRFILNLLMSWHEYQTELARLTHDNHRGTTSDPTTTTADDPITTDDRGDEPTSGADDVPTDDHDDGGDEPSGDGCDGTSGPTERPRPTPPRPSHLPGIHRGASHHAGTQNGTWIDPWDLLKWSWGAELRRAVIGTDSTIIDLGRTARFFTGTARDAVMLASPRCIWAGCDTPTTACQADHTQDHATGGPTNPHNGLPLCGHHNRLKNHRFTVWRDPTGTFHTTRPDGTEI